MQTFHNLHRTKTANPPVYSYNLRWMFFPAEEPKEPDTLPMHFHILRHGRRLVKDTEPKHHNVKTVYDTTSATGVTSHTLRICAHGKVSRVYAVIIYILIHL